MTAPQSEFAFLGEEFLTWLWFKSEIGDSTFHLQDGSVVGITFDDFLCIAGDENQPEQTLRKGLPSRSPEATVGLQTGRRLVRSRLIVACGHDEWTLTLDGPRLAFSAVKNVDSDPDEVEDARDLGRMQAFVRVGELIEAVYCVFLRERLQPDFSDATLSNMKTWVAKRDAM